MEYDYLHKEYSDLTANMRHYANMRFAQLTIFIAITAALLKFLFDSNSPLQFTIREVLTWGGFLISLVFWAMEISSTYMWRHFARRAVVLEVKLGYRQYSTLPTAPKFTFIGLATWAVEFLFLVVSIFWLVLALDTINIHVLPSKCFLYP